MNYVPLQMTLNRDRDFVIHLKVVLVVNLIRVREKERYIRPYHAYLNTKYQEFAADDVFLWEFLLYPVNTNIIPLL